MRNLFWLTDKQSELLRPLVPKSHGKPRIDDRRAFSGMICVNRSR
jgi:transposase